MDAAWSKKLLASCFSLSVSGYLAAIILLFLLPAVLPRFYIYFAALILVTGLFATSLNLVLGYGGLYQFHHAVFYGAGAYAFALMITRAHAPLWLAWLAAPLTSSVLGFLIGAICVRLSKLYFGMLQISLGSLVWAIVFRWYSFTGGGDGIHGIPLPDSICSTAGAYYFTAGVVVLCMFIMYRIVNSPFGKIFQAIRDNPERSEAIGVNIRLHQLKGVVMAAFFAGIAGALYVVVEASVVPDLMFWTLSLEVLVMCLLGGWYTFPGPYVRGRHNAGSKDLCRDVHRALDPDPRNNPHGADFLSSGRNVRFYRKDGSQWPVERGQKKTRPIGAGSFQTGHQPLACGRTRC